MLYTTAYLVCGYCGEQLILQPIHTSLFFLCPTQMADYSYRTAVRELIPQLRYLDDLWVEEDERYCSSTMGDDWAVLRNSIRDLNLSQADTEDGVCVFIYCFVISSSPVDYYSVFNEAFHLCRGGNRGCTPLQQSCFCQAPSPQPCLCQAPLVSRLQTTHWLQTHDGNQAWSFIPSWIQTWFCRLRSNNICSRK